MESTEEEYGTSMPLKKKGLAIMHEKDNTVHGPHPPSLLRGSGWQPHCLSRRQDKRSSKRRIRAWMATPLPF